MKRATLLLLGLVCLLRSLNAQNSFTTDTSFNTQMNHIFSNLDKSRVPFGILRDFSMEFTNLAVYNGVNLADSAKTSYATVMDIYNTLASGAISTNAGSLVHPLVFDSLWQTQRQAGVITLAGLFFQYASVLTNAVASNLITVTGNQLYDKFVGGTWQNPYQSQKVFALSPSINFYNSHGTYSVKVVLPASAWISNSASLVSGLTADFADGLGFRALATNQIVNLTYPSGGIKTWAFKLALTDGSVLQSRTDVKLDSASFLTFNFSKSNSSGLASANRIKKMDLRHFGFPAMPAPTAVTADLAFYGQRASGFMTVSYANSDMKFHRPLIVAEGFDAGDITDPEQLTGQRTISDFMNDVGNSSSAPLYNLINQDFGSYDIIYVDWAHSGDFIERNAMLLEKVIATVNANRAASSTSPNVVLGISMGALVARYALKDMEKNGIDHQTNLYISWDGPHQGANVPIAYQYLSRQARSLFIQSALPQLFSFYSNIIHPGANNFVTTIKNLRSLYSGSPYSSFTQNMYIGDKISAQLSMQDFPSAREMLINYLALNYLTQGLGVDNSLHNSWQANLKLMGYPQGFGGRACTNVAVSNGSQCAATEGFLPGQAMLDIRGNVNTSFLGDIIGSMVLPDVAFTLNQPSALLSVLPGSNIFNLRVSCYAQTDGVSAQQYVGTLSYTKVMFWAFPVTTNWTNWNVNSDASILPYDYFPGGEYSLGVNLQSSTNNDQSVLLAKYSLHVNAEQPSFDFIPVTSALDIGSGNVTLAKSDYLTGYVGASPPITPKNSPFSSFITGYSAVPNNNEAHTLITSRNGNWVAGQMNGTPIVDNCSFYCTGTASVTGSSLICSGSTTYTFSGVAPPAGSSVIWTAYPVGIVSIAPIGNGTQATITKIGTGSVLIGAYIGTCSNIVTTHLLQCGAFAQPTYINVVPDVCAQYGFNTNSLAGATFTWQFHLNPYHNNDEVFPNKGSNVKLNIDQGPGTYSVGVTAVNTCGSSPMYFITTNINCGGSNPHVIRVSPNPSTGSVTVSTASPASGQLQSDASIGSTAGGTKQLLPQAKKYPQIKVLDQTGSVLKRFSYPGGTTSVNINLGNLANGVYVLQIYDNVSWSSQQVAVLK